MGRGDPMIVAPEAGRRDRHDLPTILFHWLIAALIIGLLCLGFWMTDLPKGSPDRAFYFGLHKSFGVLAGVLILARILWRLSHKALPPASNLQNWEVRISWLNHRLLYLLMVIQPLSGYIGSAFGKYGVKFFGLNVATWASENPVLKRAFSEIHEIASVVLVALLALHILAALKHRFLDKDRIFQRMLP